MSIDLASPVTAHLFAKGVRIIHGPTLVTFAEGQTPAMSIPLDHPQARQYIKDKAQTIIGTLFSPEPPLTTNRDNWFFTQLLETASSEERALRYGIQIYYRWTVDAGELYKFVFDVLYPLGEIDDRCPERREWLTAFHRTIEENGLEWSIPGLDNCEDKPSADLSIGNRYLYAFFENDKVLVWGRLWGNDQDFFNKPVKDFVPEDFLMLWRWLSEPTA